MTQDNRRTNAASDLRAAGEALRAAEALLALGLLRDAVSRAYYAAFHAMRALVLLEGYEPKTHAGLLTLFAQHVVAPGRLEARYNLLAARLAAYRNASDYAFEFDMPADEVRAEIVAVRELVERTRQLLDATPG